MKSSQVKNMSPRILVVDDEYRVTSGIARGLRKDTDIIAANDGRRALSIVKTGLRLDLMVLDVCMPDYDAVELLQDMAKIKAFPPIILMSGANVDILEMVSRLAALKGFEVLGALSKPFDIADMKALMPAQSEPDTHI